VCGKICLFPIFIILEKVDTMRPEDSLSFSVDDPLVLKFVPEELENYPGMMHRVNPVREGRVISIHRGPESGGDT